MAEQKKTKKEKIAALKAQKPGLWRNVALKKLGAGKKRKPGEKSQRPTDAAFKASRKKK